MNRLWFTLCVAMLFVATVASQKWVRLATTGPKVGADCDLAYDPVNKGVVLFGRGETWLFKAGKWSKLTSVASPPPRSYHRMACDTHRDRVVLYGGSSGSGPKYISYTDTWEWDGSRWLKIAGSSQPTPVLSPGAMAYDRGRKKMVRGHFSNGGGSAWEYDGKAWQPLPGGCPGLSTDLAYDTSRFCLVGKCYQTNGNRISEYHNGAWVMSAVPVTQLSSDLGHTITFYPGVGIGRKGWTILQGGKASGFNYNSKTWAWDGTVWRSIAAHGGPGVRMYAHAAYCPDRGSIILYGGTAHNNQELDDTWELVIPTFPASFTSTGPGCKGATMAPLLAAPLPPSIGGAFSITLSGAQPVTPAAFLLGLTNPNFSLAAMGAPGCTALADPTIVFLFVTDFSGTWHSGTMLTIPPSLHLLGGRFYAQFYVQDLKANTLGLITSNGGCGVLGF